MLTPKLSEVIFFFLVLSATPGPAEPRGPRGSLASPILVPDKGKNFFLKCSSIFYIYYLFPFSLELGLSNNTKGAFNNYVDRFWPFLDPPLRGQFLYPERGQKQLFFAPPPHLVHVVIECSPRPLPTE